MAIGRVNVANVDVKNLSIFEIDSSIDTTYERSFNVFSQVGTDSTRHQIYSENLTRTSYGRDGNILFLEPIKEGETWWVVEYNFDTGEFEKQQDIGMGPKYYAPSIIREGDFNRVRVDSGIEDREEREKVVVLGETKTPPPKYGEWISNDMSVDIKHRSTSVVITYYKNGSEEMFSIIKDYYFFRGFIFVNNKIAVITTKDEELQAARVYDTNRFYTQIKKDDATLVGWFGGKGYQFIYDAINDIFLDIHAETGRVVERRFTYKSVDW